MKCPFCAEEVQEEAILCYHCGKRLIPSSKAEKNERFRRIFTITTITLLILGLAGMGIWSYISVDRRNTAIGQLNHDLGAAGTSYVEATHIVATLDTNRGNRQATQTAEYATQTADLSNRQATQSALDMKSATRQAEYVGVVTEIDDLTGRTFCEKRDLFIPNYTNDETVNEALKNFIEKKEYNTIYYARYDDIGDGETTAFNISIISNYEIFSYIFLVYYKDGYSEYKDSVYFVNENCWLDIQME